MKAQEFEPEFSKSTVNRTGIMTNPELSAELIEGTKKTVPSSKGDGSEITASLAAYADGPTIGSEPEPVNVEPPAEDLPDHLETLSSFLDKLGERLAFERQGTRLYEAFIRKCELLTTEDRGGPELAELRHIHGEEKEHFEMLQATISLLGGDATVQTPSADVAGVLSHGILQIVSDPRTTIAQALQAVLVAELSDNDGWQMLAEHASVVRRSDLQEKFEEAFQEEQEHLQNVRQWLSAMMLNEVAASGTALESQKKAKPRKTRKSTRTVPNNTRNARKSRKSSGAKGKARKN